jgi:hypothetical protein
MATYRFSTRPEHVLRRRWKAALRLMVYASVAVAGFVWAKADWMLDISKIAGFLGLATAYGLWKMQRTLRRSASIVVIVSAEGVHYTDATGRERSLPRDEIASIGDLLYGAGLSVRAVHPRKSLIVPRDIEHFDECRAEFLAMGIPLTPMDRNRMWKLWAILLVFCSMVALVVAKSLVIEIICGGICGGTILVMWTAGWLKRTPAGQSWPTGQSCALPDKSPEEAARSRRKFQQWGVGLTAAGIAIMMLEAWWTHGTDELAFGFCVVLIGVIVFAVGFFSGTLRASVLAFLALASVGAAIGGGVWWLRPSSDLGGLIAMSVGLLVAAAFVVSLLGRLLDRQPWLATTLDVLFGPALIAMGVVTQLRGHGDHGLTIVAGIILTLFAIGMRNTRIRPTLLKLAFPLKLAAIGLAFVGVIGGYKNLTWPCLIVFWLLPGRLGDRTNQKAPRAGVAAAVTS